MTRYVESINSAFDPFVSGLTIERRRYDLLHSALFPNKSEFRRR